MKDLLSNPMLYCLLVPVVIGLWPLLVWFVSIPNAQTGWQQDQDQYNKAQTVIAQILTIDPDRLQLADANDVSGEFSYSKAVNRVANMCRIPSTNYNLSSGAVLTSSGQKSQTAKVVLSDVDIVRFARFLSTIRTLWADLQCEKLKLAKTKGMPDLWEVQLDFRYYY